MSQRNTMTTQTPPLTSPWVGVLSITALAFLLAGCEPAMPVALQEPIEVRVEGRVTDAGTGAPLDSVVVVMWSGIPILDEVTHDFITTEEDGLYSVSHRFGDECPGDLAISARHRSFRYESERVDLECTDGARQVNFELVRSENARAETSD